MINIYILVKKNLIWTVECWKTILLVVTNHLFSFNTYTTPHLLKTQKLFKLSKKYLNILVFLAFIHGGVCSLSKVSFSCLFVELIQPSRLHIGFLSVKLFYKIHDVNFIYSNKITFCYMNTELIISPRTESRL